MTRESLAALLRRCTIDELEIFRQLLDIELNLRGLVPESACPECRRTGLRPDGAYCRCPMGKDLARSNTRTGAYEV